MLTCIIIEDQPPAQRILQKYIKDFGQLELLGTFSDALSALEFLNQKSVAIIFLDIHLPKLSGIEFLKILPNPPKIILTTAFADYALQGYEFDVSDYLLKPFSFERFVKAISKVLEQEEAVIPLQSTHLDTLKPANNILFVKTGKEYQKIDTTTIQFIKSNGDYTQIFTTSEKYLVSHSLKYWIEKLAPQYFCQIHKSYLVNVPHITKVTGNQVYIADQLLPIGRTYREDFVNNYLEGDL